MERINLLTKQKKREWFNNHSLFYKNKIRLESSTIPNIRHS